MGQPVFRPESQHPELGADSGAGGGDLAALVTGLVDDPRGWFARALIDTEGLNAPAGRVLAAQIEDIAEHVFPSDPAAEGRLSRSDMVSFAQATSRQIARMEALRSWAMAMLTRDAAYHECDTDWATDDGTGRACPTCTNPTDDGACADDPATGQTGTTDETGESMAGPSGDRGGASRVDGRVDGRGGAWKPGVSPVAQVGLEMSAALGMSPTFATTVVDAAVDQVVELPATWAAMTAGMVDGYKARLIAAGTRSVIENTGLAPTDPHYPAEVARREHLRHDIETRVLPNAGGRTGEQLRRQIRRLVLRADPDTTRKARKAGTADRRVSQPHTRDDNPTTLGGIASMTLHGPIEDLHALYHAIDAAARHTRTTHGDPRTLHQLRFDTLTSLGWHALRTGHLRCTHHHQAETHTPTDADAGTGTATATDAATGTATATKAETGAATDTGAGSGARTTTDAGADAATGAGVGCVAGPLAQTVGRRPVEIRVTVSLATLLGLNEDPADLDGVGPIPADLALDLAHSDDATWHRLITDPLTGALLDHGHRTYRPPTTTDTHIRTRDSTCRFPTTLTTAHHADLDHTTPFHHADTHPCPGHTCDQPHGRTAAHNLGTISRRAHTARTHHHWQLTQPQPGTFQWTSPAGHTHTTHPDPLTPPEPEVINMPMNDDPPPF